jgi:membrane dipeptidase
MLIQVNFYPAFVSSTGRADVNVIANHVEHIAKVSGKKQFVSSFRF